MKICIYVVDFILILVTVVYFTIIGIQSTKNTIVSVEFKEKNLKSSTLLEYSQNVSSVIDTQVENESFYLEEENDDISVVKETVSDNSSSNDSKSDIINDVIIDEEIQVTDVLETQVGSLSGYGPDCYGCSGFLASGLDVRDGTIYYSDATYGNVRILAGDRSYPYGTIVRVKNSKTSEFIGIVLDRGSAIGFGKSHLFDLLFPSSSEALAYEVSYNTTFEILRYGY